MADPILQPFQLKHLTLRNRVMITSHEPAYSEDGLPTDAYRAYHVERARAGIALTMTAGSAVVSRDSPPAFGNLLAYRDEITPHMARLAREVHDEGAAVMIQLTHLGRRTRWDTGDWLPVLSPSALREPAHRAYPKVLEDWDIARIISDYADAAERMKDAGLDGIELESYGHLMDAFWSPRLNHLDGRYGAETLETRMAFSMDVLRAIRARVGDDFIVGVRFVADEDIKGGISATEGQEIARRLRDSGMVDFLNVIRGNIDTDASLTRVIPLQGMASAPHLDFAGELRAQTGIPVFHAARIPDLSTARHAIAAGKLDMVGMTRAHIADPHIMAKLLEGREEDIRPCVGANYCIDRIYQGEKALCLHNPSTGRELSQPHKIAPTHTPTRVTIIGAGPAGLEAARVAATRGHQVHLLEAAPQAGGQIRLTAQSPRRREMLAITEWRVAQCEKLGVRLQYNTYAEPEDVLATAPDVVIVATGGMAREGGLETGSDLICSAWDILSGDVKPEGDMLIFDEAGDYAGLQAAEFAAPHARSIEIITRDRAIAPEVMGMNLTPYIRALQHSGAQMTITWYLSHVTRTGNRLTAHLISDYSDKIETREVDQVVVNQGTTPLDDLYFTLKPQSRNLGELDYHAFLAGQSLKIIKNPDGQFDLYRIGDAVSPRNTHAAIYDGLRLARSL